MTADAGAAPPLGQRPNEPTPGKDSLEHPQGRETSDGGGSGKGTCPDCGLPFGEHPEYHAAEAHGPPQSPHLPGQRIDERELGGDPAEA